MAKDLLVRMTIPIGTQPIVSVPSMMFNRWLPIDKKDFLSVKSAKMKLTFWFEPSSAGRSDAKELSSWVNVTAHSMNADVLITNVPDALANYIVKSSDKSGLPESKQKPRYEALGTEVYTFTIEHYNRLMAYFRSYKGQYWLEDRDPDPGSMGSHFTEFKPKVRVVGHKKWYCWRPTELLATRNIVLMGDLRFVTKKDWKDVGKFVRSNRSTPLVLDLLAKAEMYEGQEQHRPALIEAVAALEIAVARFGAAPKAQKAFGSILATRLGTVRLAKQIAHMGFTGTINYLFPVIFSEENIPLSLLKVCQEAVDERGNVVHNSQRDVPKDRLEKYLAAIREMCDILEGFSDN